MRQLLSVVFLFAETLNLLAQEEKPKPAYDLSLSREDKIKLAESAAPSEISTKAAVYVLERNGYVKIRESSNGFTCFVDRQTLWNSEPTCFDAEGTATTFPTRLFVEEQRAKGKNEVAIKSELEEGYKSGKFKAPGKPGIVYMLSDSIFLFVQDKIIHAPPHLMFYAPYATDKDLGFPPSRVDLPRLIRAGQPDAYIIVFPKAAEHSGH